MLIRFVPPGRLLLAAAIALAPLPVRAAGFAIFEQGARGMGFAGAYTAQTEDGSAIFHNAAGIAFLKGTQVYIGGTLIHPSSDFTGAAPFPGPTVTETGDVGIIPVPSAYFTTHLSRGLVLGVGVYSPFGLKTQWANPDTYSGRFISLVADLKSISLNPTLAYKLADRLSIGAGLDVRFSSVNLVRRVAAPVNPFTQKAVDIAEANLQSNTNTGIGFNLGLLAKPTESLALGVGYRHKVKVDYDGTATFTQIPTGNTQFDALVKPSLPAGQPALKTSIEFPSILTSGVAYTMKDWTIAADVDWYHWTTFQTLGIVFVDQPGLSQSLAENYTNSWQFRFGVERRLNETWAVRAGYCRDNSPVPAISVTPLLPDADRDIFALGLSWTSGRLRLDAGAWYLHFHDRSTEGLTGTTTTGSTRTRQSTAACRSATGSRRGFKMKNHRRSAVLGLAFLALAVSGHAQTGVLNTPPNFKTYVALGDSLTAGVSSASLVQTHQVRSYPALLAQQAGVADFQQPLVSEPGIPPELTLMSLLPATVIAPKAATPGSPLNLTLPRPYNNLGVPGATSIDCLSTTSGGAHDLVLRGLGTAVQEAIALKPTFITLWIGNNDVLGAAVAGEAIDGVTLTPTPIFRAVYGQIVTALKSTGATIVAANLPDVTNIPFVTTVPSVVVNPTTRQPVLINGQPVPLIGPNGPVPPGSFVTLNATQYLAQGIGIPTGLGGTGAPLPDNVILDPTKVAIIRDHVNQDNQAIADICQLANIPVLDINSLLKEFATTGRDVGGIVYSSAFLTGGIFGYDGVHPTEMGYAIVANEWVRVINANGGSLSPVDLSSFVFSSPTAARVGVTASSQAPRPPIEFSRAASEQLLALFPRVDGR
jgi:long-chain fatty acid transport protein